MNLIYTHLQIICIGKYLRTEITQTNIKSGEIFKKKKILMIILPSCMVQVN